MDKSKVYRELIHNVLTEYRNLETSNDGLETVALFDDVQNIIYCFGQAGMGAIASNVW
jgi:hypothetical protein